MKQGKIYNKIILALLLAGIVSYIVYAVVSAIHAPLTTVQATEYEAGLGCRVAGYVVRTETVLSSGYAITVPERAEGEKVGAGQTVATGYLTADAQERQAEMERLAAELQQMRYADAYGADPADTAALDQQILLRLGTFAQLAARQDLAGVREMSTELKGLVLRRSTESSDLGAIRAQAESLEARLSELQSAAGGETMRVLAPVPGYFSGTADGYETVLTPARLETMTAAELSQLPEPLTPEGACGRLVADATWYFAAVVPTEQTEEVRAGDAVSVSFTGDFSETLPMTVTRLGEDEGGERLLVLQSSDFIQDVTLLRRQSADIVFRSYAGLRVPKEALQVDEQGRAGVFVLESAVARWKPVRILYDNGESYVVELDKSSTANLWPGDEIIVRAKNLKDGKVVMQS